MYKPRTDIVITLLNNIAPQELTETGEIDIQRFELLIADELEQLTACLRACKSLLSGQHQLDLDVELLLTAYKDTPDD